MKFPPSLNQLEADCAAAPEGLLKHKAALLIEGGKAFELNKLKTLAVAPRYGNIIRDVNTPPEFTAPELLVEAWADNEDAPLEAGEYWNSGRRATHTGLCYSFNSAGKPVNPYMNTGLNGRGSLGQFAVNHAVDNGILVLKLNEQGQLNLYTLGILRKHDNDTPAFSGGFVKFEKNEAGEYEFNHEAIIESQVEELFEEMISGSVELEESYQPDLHVNIALRIDAYRKKAGIQPSSERLEEIYEQEETALKLRQVRENDPEFFKRLRQLVAAGRECFAGPALNDPRSTNNAWIETKLSWFLLTLEIWQGIKSDTPRYDYRFEAGDDSSGIVYHRLDAEFVRAAYASHGAMACFMAASYLLQAAVQHEAVDVNVLQQMDELIAALPKSTNNLLNRAGFDI